MLDVDSGAISSLLPRNSLTNNLITILTAPKSGVVCRAARDARLLQDVGSVLIPLRGDERCGQEERCSQYFHMSVKKQLK